MSHHREGIVHVTLIAPDLTPVCHAYTGQLAMAVARRTTLDVASAAALDRPDLVHADVVWLANSAGEPVLRVIADPNAEIREPMQRHGWLSLEVLVGDVDGLVDGLREPFTVLGEPANLELSDAIRAAQVLGPCGELLYLTQIKRPVPPFDLPMTDATVAVPFIGVMSTPDRDASRAAWSALLDAEAWVFDTRITVLNRALARPLEGQYPVAVVPMPGQCMVEIDQVNVSAARGEREAGLYSVGVRVSRIADDVLKAAGWHVERRGAGRSLVGPAGEHVELISS